MTMLRLLSIGLAILVISQGAFASKARLTALGQDKDGSLYVDDERSIFLNPATLAQKKNTVNFELGKSLVTVAGTSSPKAEGGLIYKMDSNMLAVQLGRTHRATESMLENSALATGTFYVPQNSVELIFAKPGEMSWGAGLHYAKAASDRGVTANFPDSEASVVSLSSGLTMDKYAAFLNLDLVHKSETKDLANSIEKYDGKLTWSLGGTYTLDANRKVGALLSSRKFSFDNGAAVAGDFTATKTEINVYRKFAADKFYLFATGALNRTEYSTEYSSAGANAKKITKLNLPVCIGLEVPANSWLTFRGSVRQSLLISSDKLADGLNDLDKTNNDDTIVAAGVSILMDQLTIDGTLEGSDTAAASAKLNGNELLANIGIRYNF